VRRTPEESNDDAGKPDPNTADKTREALDFCFEDVSSLRMVGAAPLSDLYASPGPRRSGEDAGRDQDRGPARRWNLVALVLLALAMAGLIVATVLGR
jgi:hypothetical protein